MNRLHNTKKQFIKFEDKTHEQVAAMKPIGLWYSVGNEWIKWVESKMPQWKGGFDYTLSLNEDKILHLKTSQQLFEFTEKFGSSPTKFGTVFDDLMYIDWPKVAEIYSGIEIAPYQVDCKTELMWYYGWDVASGCIWKADGIKQIIAVKEINKLKENTMKRKAIKQYKSYPAYTKNSTDVFVNPKTKTGEGANDNVKRAQDFVTKLDKTDHDEIDSRSVKRMKKNFKRVGSKLFAGGAGSTGGFKHLTVESITKDIPTLTEMYWQPSGGVDHAESTTALVGELSDRDYTLIQHDAEVNDILEMIGEPSDSFQFLMTLSDDGELQEVWGLDKPIADETAVLIYKNTDTE